MKSLTKLSRQQCLQCLLDIFPLHRTDKQISDFLILLTEVKYLVGKIKEEEEEEGNMLYYNIYIFSTFTLRPPIYVTVTKVVGTYNH